MSMLSAQCDELRTMAESVGLAMPQAATLMMDAADTIWELRDDLQRANSENVRLKQELETVGTAAYMYGQADLATESAKLRELLRDMYRRFHGVVIENWSYSSEDFYTYEQRMRELGVEAN